MYLSTILSLAAIAEALPQFGGGFGDGFGGGGGFGGGTTMLRFGCAQIVIDRLDPYVLCKSLIEHPTDDIVR